MKEADSQFHERQIERYLSQIIRAFSNFYVHDGVVRDGEVHSEKVPVIYGSPSRVVAAFLSDKDEFRNVKVPIMAVNMTSIELDDEAQLNPYHENEFSYVSVNDGERKNIRRISGKSLRLGIDLHIYGSSVQELMQIFENVVLTFNPEVVIQKSSDFLDQDYITSIRLEGINNEISNPLGEDSRVAEMTLNFTVPVTLSYSEQRGSKLEQIRVDVMNENSDTIETEIINQL